MVGTEELGEPKGEINKKMELIKKIWGKRGEMERRKGWKSQKLK